MTLVAAASSSITGYPVLYDVVIVLAVAVVFGMILQRLGMSVLPGYLIAGVLLGGPGSLGLIDDVEAFSLMGEVGVAMLLFTMGLELPWKKVQRLGGRPLLAGGVQVALTLVLGTMALVALGLSPAAAVTVAMAVSMSSTAVVIQLLQDRAESDSVHGLASTGVLIAQDLAVVVFLLIVPQLGSGGSGGEFHGTDVAMEAVVALGKLVGLVALMYVLELVVMRRLFSRGGPGPRQELLALTSLVVSLGAVGLCFALDLSPALGGFVAGVLMADAPYADQVRSEIATIRAGLVALFFAWVGMLADIGWMVEHAPQILLAVLAVVVVKVLFSLGALRMCGVPAFAAAISAAALAQLGEFSFAILATGRDVGVIDRDLFQLMVSTSLVTLLLTPLLLHLTSTFVHRRAQHTTFAVAGFDAADGPVGRVVVVGYGPAGRAVVEASAKAGYPVSVVELNPRGMHARGDDEARPGVRRVFGDAARPQILVRAGLMTARMLVVTIPEPASVRTIIRHARELAPGLHIVARGRYNIYVDDICKAGADEVIDEENVTGASIAAAVLERLAVQDNPD